MKEYKQIQPKERQKIAFFLTEGHSCREIAKKLGRTHSTVLRELARQAKGKEEYDWTTAQNRTRAERYGKRNKIKGSEELEKYITDKLQSKWSPEQIAGRLKRENTKLSVCMQTIYAFVKSEPELKKLLPNYKRKRYVNNRCIMKKLQHLPSIHTRPDKVSIGDYEADLVSFGRKSKQNVTTLFDRSSRSVRLLKNADGRAETVLSKIYEHSAGIRTLTMDRGIEFLRPHELRQHGIEPYYCDPMSPWQKGGCENTNGRLRRWLPRGTDITLIDQADLDKIASNMNNTPRKCIGFLTPKEFNSHPPNWCTSN
jgi:IS30 family transposase